MPRAGHGGSHLNDAGEPVSEEKASWSAANRFHRCRSVSGMMQTVVNTMRPISTALPISASWRLCRAHREHGGLIILRPLRHGAEPGGVRIGTTEIYRQVERFAEVMRSMAVGQDWQGDVRVILFVHDTADAT